MYAAPPRNPAFVLFQTPVFINLGFFILVVIFSLRPFEAFGWVGAVVTALAIFISLMVHEFGHVYAAKTNGHRSYVVLEAMGAYTMPSGASEGWRGMWLSVAGPMAGFVLWAILWFGFMPSGVRELGLSHEIFKPLQLVYTADARGTIDDFHGGHVLWAQLCWFNLVWGLFNLVPMFPLDGGHIVQHLLRMKFRAIEATRYSAISSLAVAAGVFYFVYQIYGTIPTFTLIIVGYLAYMNFERMRSQ